MVKNNLKLIVLFTVFWTLVVSMIMLSANSKLEAYVGQQKERIVEVECDTIHEEIKVKIPHREVKISYDGIKHIKQYENLVLVPYHLGDSTKYAIGYGHLIKLSDPIWLKNIVSKYKITKSDAEKILDYDINSMVNPALNRIFRELEGEGVNTEFLSQGFIDGLGSLIYNCGESGIKNTEFYRHLKNGEIELAIAKVEKTHVYMKGHYVRRLAEAEMMSDS